MEQINLAGSVVVCGVAFSAKPGDRIVIVNGVCLGVYTGASPALTAPAAPKRRRDGKTAGARVGGKTMKVGGKSFWTKPELVDPILSVLKNLGGADARVIADKMTVAPEERAFVSGTVRWLVADGKIVETGQTGTGGRAVYALPPLAKLTAKKV